MYLDSAQREGGMSSIVRLAQRAEGGLFHRDCGRNLPDGSPYPSGAPLTKVNMRAHSGWWQELSSHGGKGEELLRVSLEGQMSLQPRLG